MFQSFISWYQNDVKARIKLLFIVVVFIFMSLLVLLIIVSNSSVSQNQSNNTAQSVSNSELTDAQKRMNDTIESRRIEKRFDHQIAATSSIHISSTGIISGDIQGNLYRDNSLLVNNFQTRPFSLFEFNGTILFNSENRAYAIQNNTATELPESIVSVYPFNGYVFTLEKTSEENVFVIKRYNSVPNGEFGVFVARGSIGENAGDSALELRVFQERSPMVFMWQNELRREKLALFAATGQTLASVGSIDGVLDSMFYKKGFLLRTYFSPAVQWYNFAQNTSINAIIESAQTPTLNSIVSANDINTDIMPSRCDFKSDSVFVCLIKEDVSKSATDMTAPDQIVEINTATQSTSVLYSNILLSARSLHWHEAEKTHYIVNQLDSVLYKIIQS